MKPNGAVNPVLVIKNNLPDYKAELLRKRETHIAAVNKIDAELHMIEALAKIVTPTEPIAVGSFTPNDNAVGRG